MYQYFKAPGGGRNGSGLSSSLLSNQDRYDDNEVFSHRLDVITGDREVEKLSGRLRWRK